MKITVDVWVNWNSQTVISPEEHQEIVRDTLETEWYNDESYLEDFLTENYSSSELLNMTESEKDKVREKFREQCEKVYCEDEDEYTEETVTLDLDERELRHLLRIL